MKVNVTGVGCWMRGIHSWQQFVTAFANNFSQAHEAEFEAPKPQAIPPRERRRAGLTINLAVEVAHQACEAGAMEKCTPASFFTSAMGDTDIMDYMCRKLAQDERLLSPTKFHNSVHNATSGYWTISAENRQPSGYIGAFEHSFGIGLLETACWVATEHRPALLAAYDVRNEQPFQDVRSISETLGIALLLDADMDRPGIALDVTVARSPSGPLTCKHSYLERLACANPAGRGLSLLEALLSESGQCRSYAVGSGSYLNAETGGGSLS